MKTCPDCGETFPTSIKARWWKCWCIRKEKAKTRLLLRRTILPNGCWIYTGPESGKGYGAFAVHYKGKNTRNAHRTSFLIFNGEIPKGHDVHHTCETKRCFNPEHLELKIVQAHRQLHLCVTQCLKGHPYTPENTLYVRGAKRCRTCHRLRQRLRRALS
jgi:HNH endonuclease